MSFTNLIGGGMIGMALGWAACLLVLYFVKLPPVPNIFALIIYIGSALTGGGVGIAILAGGVGPFGITTDLYAVLFVAVQFVGTWGFASSMLLHVFRNNTVVDASEAHDTNERIREIQGRGKDERPGVVKDQTEGSTHRTDIDAALQADTETRAVEREADRQERKEERREDREERADERRDT